MKTWYQNRMQTGVTHRGFNVPEDKYLYLTEAQAEVHNKKEQRVAKVNTPPKKNEVAVLKDWEEYESLKANAKTDIQNSETTTDKEDKPSKANRRKGQ